MTPLFLRKSAELEKAIPPDSGISSTNWGIERVNASIAGEQVYNIGVGLLAFIWKLVIYWLKICIVRIPGVALNLYVDHIFFTLL